MPTAAAPAGSPGPGPALREYVVAELAAAIQSLAARGSRMHAGIHLARKSMRRTRAVLALGDVLGPGAKVIDRELRRLNRGLSTLRDAHALVETLDRLVAKRHDGDIRLRLARARRVAAHRRAGLARQPVVARNVVETRALLVMLQAAVLGLPWEEIAAPMLQEALEATSRDVASARDRACSRDRDEDWHRWRRRVRRLSQQHRACLAAGIASAPSMFDKSLAEQLGVMQDLTLLLEHCGPGSPFSKPDAAGLRRFARTALARQRKRVASIGA